MSKCEKWNVEIYIVSFHISLGDLKGYFATTNAYKENIRASVLPVSVEGRGPLFGPSDWCEQ